MQNIKIVYGKKGEKYNVFYSFSHGKFGEYLIATTELGICSISFIKDKEISFNELKSRFPNCEIKKAHENYHNKWQVLFSSGINRALPIVLHLIGTPFQTAVWKELLSIPQGRTSSYSEIAQKIGHPHAVRAVGTAIGANPIAVIIPCHRVLRSDGGIGGYRWGIEKKLTLLNSEGITF